MHSKNTRLHVQVTRYIYLYFFLITRHFVFVLVVGTRDEYNQSRITNITIHTHTHSEPFSIDPFLHNGFL